MYPKLFTIGPFTVYSFGLMMGIGFIVANLILTLEMKRKNLNPEAAATITLFAVIFGVIGSKLLYLVEEWHDVMRSPVDMIFSPGGLTWYGGFFLATGMIYLYTRKSGLPFMKICDSAAPGLAIAYGIARIGCHLSGDGDYGMPTSLPWGAVYSNGTYPPSYAFRDFPDVVAKYGVHGVVPDTIVVHPTPIYECIMCVVVFTLLWKLRRREWVDGRIFMAYLVLSGAARFLVEFIRLNPRILVGLSEAQLIALAVMVFGAVGYARLANTAGRTLERDTNE